MVDRRLFIGFLLIFSGLLLKMGVLVHPQLGLLCGAALPGAFFAEKHNFYEKHITVMIFKYFFINLLLIRGTTIKAGILTLMEFWCVP